MTLTEISPISSNSVGVESRPLASSPMTCRKTFPVTRTKINNPSDITVDTTRTQTEEIKDADGNVTGTQNITYADNAISVSATGCKLSGAGFTISSSGISSDAKGSGDLFFLSGTSLSVENIKFAGTSDETKKTGRVFITGNSLFSTLNIGAGTLLENRRLVADEFTNYRAQGGALVSAHIMDEIKLESATSGNVVFRGNVAYGGAENFAGGGAVSASGLPVPAKPFLKIILPFPKKKRRRAARFLSSTQT